MFYSVYGCGIYRSVVNIIFFILECFCNVFRCGGVICFVDYVINVEIRNFYYNIIEK